MQRFSRRLAICFLAAVFLCGCQAAADTPNYADPDNWVYLQTAGKARSADVFFVCPTVYFGDEETCNMSLSDEGVRADFIGAVNMQIGIYDEDARFFAPFYRQAGLNVYEMSPAEREVYLASAFRDVEAAFDYYYEHYNDGRPIILAGFSQGADMCLRLMKDRFNSEKMRRQLVACYAVGWSITEDELSQYPYLKFAEGSSDTGVIISFNSEAEHVTESVIVPAGSRTLAINPLSWETGTGTADRSLNDGACFPDTDGTIISEIDHFTGAYIDGSRGTLKVTDVMEADYPPQLDIFEDGVYHVYDYQFFYRDLQENVGERIAAYTAQMNEAA
ncbi:MAG: DUF3089 domain-containing protein [Clostridia bacterium]|nr:DUF3089 domain-containing protein [Clostridia bacterium]